MGAQIIAITNQKGGVGKTTTTFNLGVGFAQAGKRVLLVDADPQGSLTISTGIKVPDDLEVTLATLMQYEMESLPLPHDLGIIRNGEGVDLLPSNIELSGLEVSLFNTMSRELVLRKTLSEFSHQYDYILIDCMDQLVQSIKDRGIITPVTLRQKEDGRYEIVSGHRRKKACELAGMATVKAEIRDLTRDEAIILMVESNLQRSTILPSEKAFSYKMRLEAMRRQGERTDLTSRPVGEKLLSVNQLSNDATDSARQIHRYIRLTNLVPTLLDMVDEGKIALRPAVELSYLTEQEQTDLVETIAYEDATPSLAQAIKMRTFSKDGRLNADVILSIMCEKKPNQAEKISFRTDRLKDHPQVHTLRLHLDNDDIGRGAAQGIIGGLGQKYTVIDDPPPRGKDVNEYLQLRVGLLKRKETNQR